MIALAACASACEPPPPPPPAPIDEPQCPNDGIECNNDRDCNVALEPNSIGFCAVEGCCAFVNCENAVGNTRQCEGPPGCLSSLPGATDELGPVCDEGLVCIFDDGTGGCLEPPSPAACVVVDTPVTRSGVPVRLRARAVDASGLPSPHPPPAVWTTSNAGATITNDEFVASCEGGAPCIVDLAAQLGADAVCLGQVLVYPPSDVGLSRIIVVDERFAPIAGASVLADGVLARETNADGVVVMNGTVRSWTVIVAGREAHSLLDPPSDIVVVARPPPSDNATSSELVDFTAIHTQGDVDFAVTGFALGSIVEARRIDVVGVPENVVFDLEGITPPGGQSIALPSSLWLTFGGDDEPKAQWTAFGDGPLAWSFGVKVPLAEWGPALSGLATGEQLSLLASSIAPFFTRGDHFVGARDAAAVRPSTLLADTRHVQLGAHDAPDAIAGAFARVAGVGFIPLGFALDIELGDEQVAGDGLIALELAPPHDGLEGSDVLIVGFAGDIDTFVGTREPGLFQLALTPPLGSSDVDDVSLPPFLPFADASFDGAVVTTTAPVDGATLYRVRFEGWSVWSAAPPTFALDEIGAPFDVSGAAGSVEAFVTTSPLSFGALQDIDANLVSMSSRPL